MGTDFNSMYAVWSPSAGRLSDGAASSFNVSVTVRVPYVDVLYTPTVTEVLKAAWVKYASMFFVVLFLLDKLCSFAFYNQLVETEMHVELPSMRECAKFRHI